MRKIQWPMLIVLLSFLASCATSIPVQVRKPAEVNMADAKEIAVLDFDYPRELRSVLLYDVLLYQLTGKAKIRHNTPEERVAFYLTDQVVRALNETGYFTIYDTRGLAKSITVFDEESLDPVAIGKKAGVQAIVFGEIVQMDRDMKDVVEVKKVKDSKTGITKSVSTQYIDITDSIAVRYRVVSTRTGKLLATKDFSDERSVRIEDDGDAEIPSYEESCMDMVDDFIPQIARQLAPWISDERRVLMKDKAKDPAMKEADALVKDGDFSAALAAYLRIWKASANPAAGVNAAIMYEVSGDLDRAAAFLEETVIPAAPSDKASRELARMKQAQRDAERLAEQDK